MMKNNILCLAAILLAFSYNSLAQTSTVVWPITSVEIHELGARVEHNSSLVFNSETSLVVKGISGDINPQTIQIDLPKGVSLETMQYKVLTDESSRNSALEAVMDSISILEVSKKMFEALLHTLTEERAFLQANRKIGSSSEVLLVDDVIEMADFLRERNQDLGLEILDVQIDIENVSDKLTELYKRYNNLLSLGADSEGVIEMTFTSSIDHAGERNINLSYLINSAFWVPEYKLFYEEGEVFVRRKAAITQNSGIDWRNTSIDLISGKPAMSISPQVIDEWVLIENSNSRSKVYRTVACPDFSNSYFDGDMEMDDIVDNFAGDSRYHFDIDGNKDVSGEGQTLRVEVDSFTLEGDIEYLAAPAINNSSYAIVHCGNWAEHKLMPGRAQVFANNSYLGSFSMTVPAVGDTLKLSLGSDPHVMCSRELSTEESVSRKFGGKKEVVQFWKLSVENTHNDTVTVNLIDRFPRLQSRDSKVQIEVESLDGGVVDHNTSEILFKMELAPLERREVTYKLTVTYPSSVTLLNL